MIKNNLKIPLNLSHIKIKSVKIEKDGTYHIYVSCTATKGKCSICKKTLIKIHGYSEEVVIEHLPIFDTQVFIHVRWPRFLCKDCNKTETFKPIWVGPNGRTTTQYDQYVLKQLINSTIKDVALKLKTTEEFVEGIIKRNVSLDIDWSTPPKRIGIDEISLKKGHKQYLTIVSDISNPKNVKIITVIKGKTKAEIIPFFSSIPSNVLDSIDFISVDMAGCYISTLKEILSIEDFHNKVVIDRFHVAKLLGDKVDSERKRQLRLLYKEYENDLEKQEEFKGFMWPFRHHLQDLSDEEFIKLENVFKLSPSLEDCYDLREELYLIYENKNYSKEEAEKAIENWMQRASEYKKESENPFSSFIKTYEKHKANILNYFDQRVTSGPVEGLNNKIKVIKRRGFGFRNIVNFTRRIFLDVNLKPQLLPAT